MSESESKEFAYGKDTIGDCACPAVKAGYDPGSGDESTVLAEEFDAMVVSVGAANAQSTVSEPFARKAWLKAIRNIKQRFGADSTEYAIGVEIAEKNGWL